VTELKTFAVRVYSAPGVSDACLALQDEQAVDVPLMLFAGWYGVHAGVMPDEVFEPAQQLSQQLGQNLIYPLRRIRRWMKNGLGDDHWHQLREAIKRNELDAELMLLAQLQQRFAPSSVNSGPDVLPDVLSNMLRCVAQPDRLTARNRLQLEQIAAACVQA